MSPLTYDESANAPPAAFGPYRVLHQIGSGVSGPVFRAFDRDGDRLIAIKAFRLDLVPEDVVKLANALRALAATARVHSALVLPTDAGLESATAFIAMPLVAGQSLDVRMRATGTIAVADALRLLEPVAQALHAAADAGLLHGALHPRDILVHPETLDVRLTGVGIGDALQRSGARAPVRRPYTAPEQIAGARPDVRADVYALGVIAHELLTGRRPARAGEQDGSFDARVAPEQRVELRRWLATALSDRPADRFASLADFIAAFKEIARSGRAVAPHPVPPDDSLTDRLLEELDREAAIVPVPRSTEGTEVGPGFSADFHPLRDPDSGRSASPQRHDHGGDGGRPENARRAPSPHVNKAPVPGALPRSTERTEVARLPGDVLATVTVRSQAADGGRLENARRPPSPQWIKAPAVIAAGLVVGVGLGLVFGPRWLSQSAPATAGDTEVALSQDRAAPAPSADTPPPPAAATPAIASRTSAEKGQLSVRSTPSGALVFLNGVFYGETPVTLRDLALGAHVVQVARPGHVPRSERVSLTRTTPTRSMAVQLQKGFDPTVPPRGTIDVDSRPRGARVFVDGKYLGVTPLRWPEATLGGHDVRVELDGYASVSTPVVVRSGAPARVAVTLKDKQ